PAIWSLCRRLDSQPEDAYQEVWEKVHRTLDRYDSARGALGAWLFSIARNHLVDRHRRQTARGVVLPYFEVTDPSPLADDQMSHIQQSERLESALSMLAPPQRRAVTLHHIYGHRLIDIAKREGTTLGTIKSRLHRGRTRLVQLLTRQP
ncbi:MAG: sigma-70 family RNA polymerase sigma factor, partial [Proteobacteria bacterium]|nr:sigma-70 family RNA polymerase sigma factor [Pseudomonadota bacterium]